MRTIALTVLMALCGNVQAQINPRRPETPSERKAREDMQRKKAEQEAELDMKNRLVNRDKAIEKLGLKSKGFIREYGDLAVKAILTATDSTGKALVELHESGKLSGLPDPKAALAAASECGAVGLGWIADHWQELGDTDATRAFVREPAEFVHGFKDLQKYARVVRHEREDEEVKIIPDDLVLKAKSLGWKIWAMIGGGALVVIGLIRRSRQGNERTL